MLLLEFGQLNRTLGKNFKLNRKFFLLFLALSFSRRCRSYSCFILILLFQFIPRGDLIHSGVWLLPPTPGQPHTLPRFYLQKSFAYCLQDPIATTFPRIGPSHSLHRAPPSPYAKALLLFPSISPATQTIAAPSDVTARPSSPAWYSKTPNYPS